MASAGDILQMTLSKLGLAKLPVPRDGHCLLHAISEALKCEKQMVTPEKLLALIESELLGNVEFYKDFVAVSNSRTTGPEMARRKIEFGLLAFRDKQYKNEIVDMVVPALCNALRINIVILYRSDEGGAYKMLLNTPIRIKEDISGCEAIHILRTDGSDYTHYDGLIRKNSRPPPNVPPKRNSFHPLYEKKDAAQDTTLPVNDKRKYPVLQEKRTANISPAVLEGPLVKVKESQPGNGYANCYGIVDNPQDSVNYGQHLVLPNDKSYVPLAICNSPVYGDKASEEEVRVTFQEKYAGVEMDSSTTIWPGISCQLKLTRNAFLQINQIISTPKVPELNLDKFYQITCPYLVQRIKMWGCHVLSATRFNRLVVEDNVTKSRPTYTSVDIDDLFEVSKKESHDSSRKCVSVSRIDFFAYLVNACDCLVMQDILKIIAKFSIAMPFIVQDGTGNGYLCTVPLLKDIAIRWEAQLSSSSIITENYLFRSPYQMVVAIRLGSNGDRPGKSAILNSLMKKENFFSSHGEPGGRYGKPCTLHGSVEFAWLTQDTANESFWKEVVEEHYSTGSKTILLLANVHGDIANCLNILNFLKAYSGSFVIFLMPTIGKDSEQLKQLRDHLPEGESSCYLMVDSQNYKESHNRMLQTSNLKLDINLSKVRCALKSAITGTSPMNSSPSLQFPNQISIRSKNNVHMTEGIETSQSLAFISVVKSKTCLKIKQMLRMQKEVIGHGHSIPVSSDVDAIMGTFMNIFLLQPSKRKKAILQIENELSLLSAIESSLARDKVVELKAEKRKIFASNSQELSKQKDVQSQIELAIQAVEERNLGLEHFFRELICLYNCHLSSKHQINTSTADLIKLPEYCGDILMDGVALELFNGDAGTVAEDWLAAVCSYITKKLPDLKIFVISIIGLQSSGKSTLLNALFCCKFAVSVGRCSRGLFMRLVFLEENFKQSTGFDAFLLIDTEGLASAERMNDKASEERDRKMATFAIGVSDLTIINIMGENITEITEILQIAMVAMARLGKEDMASDILLVQHLQERDAARLAASQENFCEAVKYAITVLQKNNAELGVLNDNCLHNFIKRIHSGDFLKQFSPLRDGSAAYASPSEAYHNDVVDLYETILLIAKGLHNKQTIQNWSRIVDCYWNSVSKENFAVHFKNLIEFVEFIDRRQTIGIIKEAIESAFHHHRLLAEIEMRKEVQIGDLDKSKIMLKATSTFHVLPRMCTIGPNTGGNNDDRLCKQCKKLLELTDQIEQAAAEQDYEYQVKEEIKSYQDQVISNTNNMLSQMYDALVVQDTFMSIYADIVDEELKKRIQPNRKPTYSGEEVTQIASSILEIMKTVARNKETIQPVRDRVNKAISSEYNTCNSLLDLYYKKDISADTLKSEPAFEHDFFGQVVKKVTDAFGQSLMQTSLNESQHSDLVSAIKKVVYSTANSTCDFFQDVMIRKLKQRVTEVQGHFLKRENHNKFLQNFIWIIHALALKLFVKEMERKQKEWDMKHNPVLILEQKQDIYRKEIETRLKLGFSAAADGAIAANDLIQASCQLAAEDVENYLVQAVLDITWTRNAEVIRLNYFKMLAEKLKQKSPKESIDYFFSPKAELENWYTMKVNHFDMDAAKRQYKDKLCKALDVHITKMSTCDSLQIQSHINDYVCQTRLIKCVINLVSYSNPKDIFVFVDKAKEVLNLWKNNVDTSQVPGFTVPSKNSLVMGRLGCTDCCPLCGAMCWGARSHGEEHYTCHQPRGLRGVGYHKTHELNAHSCYSYAEEDRLYDDDADEVGRLWSVIKKDYGDWKFTDCPKEDFDQLMCWFFSQLHKDIATRMKITEPKTKPATEKDLQTYKCVGLNIDKILLAIIARVSN